MHVRVIDYFPKICIHSKKGILSGKTFKKGKKHNKLNSSNI